MNLHLRSVFTARIAACEADLKQSLALRRVCFRNGVAEDGDEYDARCKHMLVTDSGTGRLVCSFRFLHLAHGSLIERAYAAQFYDLARLAMYKEPLVEIGRFCIDPSVADPGVLRTAWAALAEYVEQNKIGMLFGCSSLSGVEAGEYGDAFALLKARYLAPERFAPLKKSAEVYRFADISHAADADVMAGMRQMPSLLRSYLAMGGWVSDHAVIDRDLGTMHVFTGVEVKSVPELRARALRG